LVERGLDEFKKSLVSSLEIPLAAAMSIRMDDEDPVPGDFRSQARQNALTSVLR
jgi:hypothetical protein